MALENVLVPEKVSVPPSVARVPVVGRVTEVLLLVVKARVWVEEPKVIAPVVPARVRDSLAVKVFPSAMVKVADVAGVVRVTLLMLVAEATPNVGVVREGEVARTTAPDPVVPSERFEAAGWEQVRLPEVAIAVA